MDIAHGHYSMASLTGRYDGRGSLPSGCIARFEGRIYLLKERRDSSGFRASAIEISDTNQVYGRTYFGVSASERVRNWLLALLKARGAAG